MNHNQHKLFELLALHTPPTVSMVQCVNIAVALDHEGVRAPVVNGPNES